GSVHGRGSGRTKKAAEQEAAEAAWRALSAEA
ncbi:MAG: putative dsRNA-binding protein, partial [Actinomycetes bacterium]